MSIIKKSHFYEPFQDEIFKRMPSADGISSQVSQHYILGSVRAKDEWSNPNKARNTFVHLSAYNHFINKEQLILLGRTGSGKSAIMYCLKDDIEHQRISEYTDVIKINEKAFCEKLADLCYSVDINRFDATYKITNAITMTIQTKVMIYCFEHFEESRTELRYTIEYLLSKGFIKTRDASLLSKLKELSNEDYVKQIGAMNNSFVKTAIDISRILITTREMIKQSEDIVVDPNSDFINALEEIKNFLTKTNKNILVLLDSFDEYKINDKAFVIAIKSLIQSCFNIYTSSSEYRIFLKLALASEIYTRVLTHLPAQNQTNTVAIIWSYKDLIKCMALRFVSWYHDSEAKYKEFHYLFTFLEKYSIESLKEKKISYQKSEDIFHNILPEICKTNSEYTYLTLAFISRHTMKKPREILQIFNALIDRIIYENDASYFLNELNTCKVKDVVHSLQNDFIDQTLALYRIFIPNIDTYVSSILYGQRFVFSIDIGFDNKLKEVNGLIQSETSENEYLNYFDKVDILKVVFETGLLGKVSEVRTIDAEKIEQFGTNQPLNIIDALFEYQFKGKLQKNSEVQYVIHPMCYEHYSCSVGMRSMVNTDSYDSTELLTSIIADE